MEFEGIIMTDVITGNVFILPRRECMGNDGEDTDIHPDTIDFSTMMWDNYEGDRVRITVEKIPHID